MSQLKVNTIRHTGASSDNITLASDGTATAKITNLPPGNRNLVINGGMRVAQRSTSSTSGDYSSIDRWKFRRENISAGTCTQSQQSLSSSDSPWNDGHKNFARLALGQAGTAASNSEVSIETRLEAQDIACSGWDFKNASSKVTLSFWMRASTNQTFQLYVYDADGGYKYPVTFTASGNNAWTKKTITIPGNSNLNFADDNGHGLQLKFIMFFGTGYTNNASNETWASYSGTNFVADMASTWLTAGASTFDLTGVQLEVGDAATDYEHRSYGDELARCQRYYLKDTLTQWGSIQTGLFSNATTVRGTIGRFPVTMRAKPTVTFNELIADNEQAASTAVSSVADNYLNANGGGLNWTISSHSAGDQGEPCGILAGHATDSWIAFSAEL